MSSKSMPTPQRETDRQTDKEKDQERESDRGKGRGEGGHNNLTPEPKLLL